jgi:hypothetical protein
VRAGRACARPPRRSVPRSHTPARAARHRMRDSPQCGSAEQGTEGPPPNGRCLGGTPELEGDGALDVVDHVADVDELVRHVRSPLGWWWSVRLPRSDVDTAAKLGRGALERGQGFLVASGFARGVGDAPMDQLGCAGKLGADFAHAIAEADHVLDVGRRFSWLFAGAPAEEHRREDDQGHEGDHERDRQRRETSGDGHLVEDLVEELQRPCQRPQLVGDGGVDQHEHHSHGAI